MSGFEWFLLIGVVIVLPLAIAIAVTLWTLEQARLRNRRNRRGRASNVTERAADGDIGMSSSDRRGVTPDPDIADDQHHRPDLRQR